MSTRFFAGNTYAKIEELREAAEKLLNWSLWQTEYSVFTDRSGIYFDIHWLDARSVYSLSKTWSVPTKDIQNILLFAKDDEHASRMLRDYLNEDQLPVGFNKKEVPKCNHDYVDVTIFTSVQKRCRYCDIKQEDKA